MPYCSVDRSQDVCSKCHCSKICCVSGIEEMGSWNSVNFQILSVFFRTKYYNIMEGTLIGGIREQSAEEDILAELGRRTGPGRIFSWVVPWLVPLIKSYSVYKIVNMNCMWKACVTMDESGDAYGSLEGKPMEKGQLVRIRYSWENNIGMVI